MGTITFLASRHKIGFLSVIFTMFGLSASTAVALDPMGPPVAGMDAGQMQVGGEYSYSRMDLELFDGRWVEYLDGVFSAAGTAMDFDLKDFKAHRAYVNVGFGPTDYFDVFVRLGGTEAEFGDSIWLDQEDFESSTDVAIGGGLKATFYENGPLKIGGLVQANWSEYNGTLFASDWLAADHVTIEIAEVQAAVGAAFTWAERFTVYGGPFVHFVSGDLDDTFSEVDGGTGGLLRSEYSWEIEEDSIFGGYFGANVDLTENCSFSVEYQITGAADAVGLSLLWRN
ncbi:MAG: hypothetical protein JXM79_15490 [Sedimentisphaerales bacterium]|nr:hypothetical protein [Sedimentisphaerales bacterium]